MKPDAWSVIINRGGSEVGGDRNHLTQRYFFFAVFVVGVDVDVIPKDIIK